MVIKLKLLLLTILIPMTCVFSQSGLGTIKGTVKDEVSKQPLPYSKVLLIQNGATKGAANTDFDGNFQINGVSPGSYDVEVRNADGYQTSVISGVSVSPDKITFLDKLTLDKPKDIKELGEVNIIAYRVPLIDKDGGSTGGTVTREDIARLPTRSAAGVAQTVGGVNSNERDGAISVRGSREDGTYFYIDGIKVRGSSNIPKSALEEVSVITGGVPANYGDVTGGIISITTRGPSSVYFGSVEAVSSGIYIKGADKDGYDGKVFGLDKFGYNLFEGMLSGPLWMQKDSTGKKTKPRLGFLISANYTDQLDSRPIKDGGLRIKKDARDALIANPLRPTSTGSGTYHNALFLRNSDFERVDWRMNARSTSLSGQAKIDVNAGANINLKFGGSFSYNSGPGYSYTGSLLNFQNFGFSKSLDYRVFGQLGQRFNNETAGSSSKIKSALYNIMVDYSHSSSESYDANHKYNLFNYGHIGKFETNRKPSYEFDQVTQTYKHNGFKEIEVVFTPSETNSALAAITTQYYDIYSGNPTGHYENLFQIQQGNALRNGDAPASVYGIWSNIGTPNNGFGKSEQNQFRITGAGAIVIGDHSISLGFEFEQRVDRGWGSGDSGPLGIWQIARQRANFHIEELDLNSGVISDSGSFKAITYERLNTGWAHIHGEYGGEGGKVDANGVKILDNQSFFDYNLRVKLGLNTGGNDYLDIDNYDPNIFSFDMFSPDELLNSGNSFVSYYGYDHTGKKVTGTTDINNYFNKYDKNGNYERFVGSFQPTYIAGYIMDKFAFKDIVFNVGARVDVFDANQPILKDPYLFYNALTVKEVKALTDPQYDWVNIPEGMGDDYIVYVNDVTNPTSINGFRTGTNWYNALGTQVEDPKVIRGATGIAPWLTPDALKQTTPNQTAFEDYKAQVNFMPRIAFSFPISDEASFFAHYDVLTKRPTSGYRFDPYEYQFIQSRSDIINNSNLKPERTVDYELGFQQVLSRTSSLKISAFYREQRNNVQLINVFEAYPATYKTYGNRDFGTVKGMTLSYDLRQTGNIRMTANYTLQFAEGTGSDATSANALIQAGLPNLRNIFPYSYDQRHAFAITFDYRYGEGEDYNGPMVGKLKLFENMGLNLFTNINSGSPYSNQTFITDAAIGNLAAGLNGTLNGSRLPWAYRLDLQVDKTINIAFAKKDDKKKTAALNIYIRVTNLFNQFNVLGVYRATGNWNDDGYLAAANSQTSIQNQTDEQSFRDYYNMKISNPFNVSSPRTIKLGIKMDF